jgi:hypothetical protein
MPSALRALLRQHRRTSCRGTGLPLVAKYARADHSFKPWWGCREVSLSCEHYYARDRAECFGRNVLGPPALN